MSNDDRRTVDVEPAENFRCSIRWKHVQSAQKHLLLGRREAVERVNHHHSAERHFLRDLAAHARVRHCLHDAILCRKFSACHRLGLTGTLTGEIVFETYAECAGI